MVDTVIIEADAEFVAVGGTLQLQATAYDDEGDVITGRPWSGGPATRGSPG